MADIDINELQNITALADADELLAIANGLGKNITWAKIKELLITQLPIASENTNGLLSKAMVRDNLFAKGVASLDNIDSLTKSGAYVHGSPIGPVIDYGVLIVFSAPPYVLQIDFGASKRTAYYRIRAESSWYDWNSLI